MRQTWLCHRSSLTAPKAAGDSVSTKSQPWNFPCLLLCQLPCTLDCLAPAAIPVRKPHTSLGLQARWFYIQTLLVHAWHRTKCLHAWRPTLHGLKRAVNDGLQLRCKKVFQHCYCMLDTQQHVYIHDTQSCIGCSELWMMVCNWDITKVHRCHFSTCRMASTRSVSMHVPYRMLQYVLFCEVP